MCIICINFQKKISTILWKFTVFKSSTINSLTALWTLVISLQIECTERDLSDFLCSYENLNEWENIKAFWEHKHRDASAQQNEKNSIESRLLWSFIWSFGASVVVFVCEILLFHIRLNFSCKWKHKNRNRKENWQMRTFSDEQVNTHIWCSNLFFFSRCYCCCSAFARGLGIIATHL